MEWELSEGDSSSSSVDWRRGNGTERRCDMFGYKNVAGCQSNDGGGAKVLCGVADKGGGKRGTRGGGGECFADRGAEKHCSGSNRDSKPVLHPDQVLKASVSHRFISGCVIRPLIPTLPTPHANSNLKWAYSRSEAATPKHDTHPVTRLYKAIPIKGNPLTRAQRKPPGTKLG